MKAWSVGGQTLYRGDSGRGLRAGWVRGQGAWRVGTRGHCRCGAGGTADGWGPEGHGGLRQLLEVAYCELVKLKRPTCGKLQAA